MPTALRFTRSHGEKGGIGIVLDTVRPPAPPRAGQVDHCSGACLAACDRQGEDVTLGVASSRPRPAASLLTVHAISSPQIARSPPIIVNPMLNDETIRLDGVIRMAPRRCCFGTGAMNKRTGGQ